MSLRSATPVVVMVKGGLGNQMFGYAAGRALADRLGRPLYLDAITGFVADQYQRKYRLRRFPVRAEMAPAAWCLGGSTRALDHRLARALARFRAPSNRGYIAEDRQRGPEQLTNLTPNTQRLYLNGYWQNEDYFLADVAAIRADLEPPAPTSNIGVEMLDLIESAPAPVFLHVRRIRYSPRLAAAYYDAAIAATVAAIPEAAFFVFGDDPLWPRTALNFAGAPEIHVEGTADETEDLHLMSRCRHAILSNSSFAWWGAWLGDYGGRDDARLVITPATPGWPVVAPARWTRLPNELETA